MTNTQSQNDPTVRSPLQLLSTQPSHVLFVVNNARTGRGPSFLNWYQGVYKNHLWGNESVVRAQHYEQHEVDITCGRHMPFPYHYLGLYHLSLDGAEQAAELVGSIDSMFRECDDADAPATWLFFPASEKVGRAPRKPPSMLTIAYANATAGQEFEFREWYATRHIRHALNIPALVSGQCFARALFQRPGAAECPFSMTAIYEQEGAPEEMIETFATLPKGMLNFPMLDRARGRFAECVYRPLV